MKTKVTLLDQHRIPVPIAIKVPKVPPPLTMAPPTPLSNSLPLNPILKRYRENSQLRS